MQYTINSLYQEIFKPVYNVYDTIKDFFGEEYTDLHIKENTYKIILSQKLFTTGLIEEELPNFDVSFELSEENVTNLKNICERYTGTIYVWWPKVTVTNENNKSIDIQDLYAEIQVQSNGTIPFQNKGFLLNRATYSNVQFASSYLHSHIQEIPKNDFASFMYPCLGTGPIAETIDTLKTNNDEAFWMLFCQELSMYVTVESLKGIPWKKLEEVGVASSTSIYSNHPAISAQGSHNTAPLQKIIGTDKYVEFIKYYLDNGHLSFAFMGDKFTLGLSPYEFGVDISNAFIEFFNKYIKDRDIYNRLHNAAILDTYSIKDRQFYHSVRIPSTDLSNYEGQYVLTFKGKDVLLHIFQEESSETNTSTILNENTAYGIVVNILNIINYHYARNHNNPNIASTSKKAIYI